MTVLSGRICRRMSPKGCALTAIGLTILLCIYYTSYTSDVRNQDNDNIDIGRSQRLIQTNNGQQRDKRPLQVYEKRVYETCPKLLPAEVDVNTVDVFKDFDFQVNTHIYTNKIVFILYLQQN